MSTYTTGEIAKLCGVSVRTVQYYDSRGILVPSDISEGGRRLYSEQDLGKMKIICYLRELDLPIDSIKKLLMEENPENVISVLLDEQERAIRAEIEEKQLIADRIADTKRTLSRLDSVSVRSIGDVAHIMKNKKKLRHIRIWLFIGGFVMDAIQVSTFMIWMLEGIWLPFVIGLCAALAIGVHISFVYFTSTAYICPECHEVFKPEFTDALFALHTPNTRKLRCTKCNYNGFCVETYGGKNA